MAKQGRRRPDRTHTHPRNEVAPVSELQGKEKTEKKLGKSDHFRNNPPFQKVFHSRPHTEMSHHFSRVLSKSSIFRSILPWLIV